MNHLELLEARTRNQISLSQQIDLPFLNPVAMDSASVPLVLKLILVNNLAMNLQFSNIHLALALLVSCHEYLGRILSL